MCCNRALNKALLVIISAANCQINSHRFNFYAFLVHLAECNIHQHFWLYGMSILWLLHIPTNYSTRSIAPTTNIVAQFYLSLPQWMGGHEDRRGCRLTTENSLLTLWAMMLDLCSVGCLFMSTTSPFFRWRKTWDKEGKITQTNFFPSPIQKKTNKKTTPEAVHTPILHSALLACLIARGEL